MACPAKQAMRVVSTAAGISGLKAHRHIMPARAKLGRHPIHFVYWLLVAIVQRLHEHQVDKRACIQKEAALPPNVPELPLALAALRCLVQEEEMRVVAEERVRRQPHADFL